MAKTLMDLLEPEIKEEKIRAVVENLVDYIALEEAIQHVAEKYNVTIEAVKLILEKSKVVV